MVRTMNLVKPPRITALQDLHDAEDRGPFSILIGTILSARTKDESTSRIVKELFKVYKNSRQLANAKVRDDEKIIKSIGFYHVKARRIIEVPKIIDSKYKGKVPDNLEKLVELPGVGRKTANCVLVYAYEKPAIPVDIHVHRISNRLGLVQTKTPEDTEFELMKIIPKNLWLDINETFVKYGQNICKPISPMCNGPSFGSPDRISRFRYPEVVAGGSCDASIPQTKYDLISKSSMSRFESTILSPLFIVNPAESE